MRGPVRITVERLVLDGVPAVPEEAAAVATALGEELCRLVAQALPGSVVPVHLAAVRAPAVAFGAGTPAAEVGRRLGGVVHTAVAEAAGSGQRVMPRGVPGAAPPAGPGARPAPGAVMRS